MARAEGDLSLNQRSPRRRASATSLVIGMAPCPAWSSLASSQITLVQMNGVSI
jgi:hypothetical protein